jgi:hypothetical protein
MAILLFATIEGSLMPDAYFMDIWYNTIPSMNHFILWLYKTLEKSLHQYEIGF